MALSPERKAIRDQRIREAFDRLSSKTTKNGKRLYTYEAIYEKLAEAFCLSEWTIQLILKSK